MANDLLRVDTDGLRSHVTNADGIASGLAKEVLGGAEGSQPSHRGVSTILAAARSVRGRQSERVKNQATSMRTGASRYDDTDGHNATNVAKAM